MERKKGHGQADRHHEEDTPSSARTEKKLDQLFCRAHSFACHASGWDGGGYQLERDSSRSRPRIGSLLCESRACKPAADSGAVQQLALDEMICNPDKPPTGQVCWPACSTGRRSPA